MHEKRTGVTWEGGGTLVHKAGLGTTKASHRRNHPRGENDQTGIIEEGGKGGAKSGQPVKERAQATVQRGHLKLWGYSPTGGEKTLKPRKGYLALHPKNHDVR